MKLQQDTKNACPFTCNVERFDNEAVRKTEKIMRIAYLERIGIWV